MRAGDSRRLESLRFENASILGDDTDLVHRLSSSPALGPIAQVIKHRSKTSRESSKRPHAYMAASWGSSDGNGMEGNDAAFSDGA